MSLNPASNPLNLVAKVSIVIAEFTDPFDDAFRFPSGVTCAGLGFETPPFGFVDPKVEIELLSKTFSGGGSASVAGTLVGFTALAALTLVSHKF